MRGLRAEEIAAIVNGLRDPFLTPTRKAQINNLAADLLTNFADGDELAAKYALFIALLQKITLVP